jgi:hypothetical protein
MAQIVDLLSKCKALSLKPSIAKKEKRVAIIYYNQL